MRAEAFLEAAREIGTREGVRKVTLTAVTRRVGMHPSALRRYFDSTEELLLDLAQQGWAEWRTELVGAIGEGRELDPPAIARAISGSLEALPLFCDLLTHVPLSLEGEVRLERARAYKLASTAEYDAMADAIVESASGIDGEGARTILTVAMTSAAYLYQLSRPTPTLQQLYAEEPRWAHSALRFRAQLTELLTAVGAGVQRHEP